MFVKRSFYMNILAFAGLWSIFWVAVGGSAYILVGGGGWLWLVA